jgi:hypothetical protein
MRERWRSSNKLRKMTMILEKKGRRKGRKRNGKKERMEDV